MGRTHLVIFVLTVSSLSAPCLEMMKAQKKPERIRFRIAAVTNHVPRSSFSPNRETYLAYLVPKAAPPTAAKIVFRYLSYEDGLSQDFADFGVVHTFKASRDRSCDESWQSFSTAVVTEHDSALSASVVARFVSTAAAQDIPPEQVLPCYVIAPQGYKGSKVVDVKPMGAFSASKQPERPLSPPVGD